MPEFRNCGPCSARLRAADPGLTGRSALESFDQPVNVASCVAHHPKGDNKYTRSQGKIKCQRCAG
eukprot:2045120-Amphidinium_carterae.1